MKAETAPVVQEDDGHETYLVGFQALQEHFYEFEQLVC